jgi:hypothetical protein
LVDRASVLAARDLIDEVNLRLLSPHPVRAMAVVGIVLVAVPIAGAIGTAVYESSSRALAAQARTSLKFRHQAIFPA